MSIQWTIVDEAGATLLAEHGFATYVDFVDHQPGQEVGKSSTTHTTRFAIRSEPRAEVPGERREPPPQVSHSKGKHTPQLPPAAAGGSDATAFFIKVYRYSGTQWRHRFRKDKASLEAANCAMLEELGIKTTQVVAFGSRRRGLRLLDAVLVTRGLPDVISLDRLFELRWPDPEDHADNALRREVIRRVIDEVRRMHDAAFFHIDLQWRNILIGGLSATRIDVFFLDAPRGGMRRSPWGIEHGRLRDLSCLYKEVRRRLSRTEQLRWLLIYLGERRVTPEARAMIRALWLDRSIKDNDSE